jgi:nitrogen fixation-related uncharacterized protein
MIKPKLRVRNMPRLIIHATIIAVLLLCTTVWAQDERYAQGALDDSAFETDAPEFDPTSIDGQWITQSGNLVEVEVNGTDVSLYFPAFARTMSATLNGTTLIYVTHYNDPTTEECYLDVPESEENECRRFIQEGDPRHRFTLTLSEDGMVLAGVKEINVLHCEWDTDENGDTSNHRAVGYQWEFFSDYQWRRSNCDFQNLPPLEGNAVQRMELIGAMFDRFGLKDEFSLGDFDVRSRVRFEYSQAYLDADTGDYVPPSETSQHRHVEPLDGRVYRENVEDEFRIELYPYAFTSYVSLLTGLTIMCHQLQAVENSQFDDLYEPTTQMEIDSVNYAWSHRQALCSQEDELFDHHIDFLSRALQFRLMAE